MVNELKNEAIYHILPYWMSLIDLENGGYFGYVDDELNVDKKYNKGGIATARILWSFSAAYNNFKNEEYLVHANHAYEFLISSILDHENLGMFWMVDYLGKVTDDRKHIYAQSFGIYGLAEYYEASKNENAYKYAMSLFELIEKKGYKESNNSYGEEFTKDWLFKKNEMLSENGVNASITTNTLLHILEAYTRLAPIAQTRGNVEVTNRLHNLVDIFINQVWNKEKNHMRVFFDENWNELIALDSYGHDIEATWLVYEALKVLGLEEEKNYNDFVTQIGECISNVAIEKDGSIIYEMENNKVNHERVWWCQAEAIVGFANLYEITRDEKYFKIYENLWQYTKARIIDTNPKSEWLYSVDKNGVSLNGPITEPWKTPYHNLRACIEIVKRKQVLNRASIIN